MKHLLIPFAALMVLLSCTPKAGPAPLPRAEANQKLDEAFAAYLDAIDKDITAIHSIMIVQHGRVLEEKFFVPDTAHILHSVSKTFTSAAVGFAIDEGLLHLDDKIVDLFPESCPEVVSDRLAKVTLRHLLTMNSGHGEDPSDDIRPGDGDWIRGFMEWPQPYEPGTCYCYNNICTYVLSAAVQKVTGEKLVDYLDTRLWKPLGIEKPFWKESPAGINTGGWGLYLHTEDLAKMGLCILNGGKYNGRQVIPADWVAQMTAKQVPSVPPGINENEVKAILKEHPDARQFLPQYSDCMQGYGYQMWMCRHGAVMAYGSNGQFIIIFPNQDAVIAVTAREPDIQKELNEIWDYLLPAL